MKRYCVPVVKEIAGYVVVEANSPEEAVHKVFQIDLSEDLIAHPQTEYHISEVDSVTEEDNE